MLKNYVPRETGEGSGENKEHVNPRDILNVPVILFVREIKSIKTKFAPEGKDAVIVDVASPATGKVVDDNAWFNDALIDQLKGEVGQMIATKVVYKQSASGYNYFTLNPLTDAELATATQFVEHKDGNPFETTAPVQAASPAPKPIEEVGDSLDSDTPGASAPPWGVA